MWLIFGNGVNDPKQLILRLICICILLIVLNTSKLRMRMLVGVCGNFFSNLQWLTFVWARIKNPTAYGLFFQAEGKDWSSSRLCFIWNALKLLWLKFVGVWWQFVSILQWLLWAGLKKPQALSLLAMGIMEEKACAVHDCPKFELHKATFVKIGWHLMTTFLLWVMTDKIWRST